jgi:hypothetical protein
VGFFEMRSVGLKERDGSTACSPSSPYGIAHRPPRTYGLSRGGGNETRKDGFAPGHSTKTHAQPPRLSPLLSTHTTRHDADLTDERAMHDAGPAYQGPWLRKLIGRVKFWSQTELRTDGQDRPKALIERWETHMA